MTFFIFILGFLIGATLILRRAVAEIFAFIVAPAGLLILVKLLTNSFARVTGVADSITFEVAGKVLALGAAAGVIVTILPVVTLHLSNKASPHKKNSKNKSTAFQWPDWLAALTVKTTNRAAATALYYETVLKLGAMTAVADGRAVPREFAALKVIFRIDASVCPDAEAIYRRQLKHPETINVITRRFVRVFKRRSGSAETIIFGMAKVAQSDGQVANSEISLIKQIAHALGIKETETVRIFASAGIGFDKDYAEYESFCRANEQARHARQRTPTERDKHLATLGLTASATSQDIRNAWRGLASKYHPDKLMSQQIPQSELEKAKALMREVNNAYDWLKA